MAEFEPAFSEEMFERLVFEVYEYVKSGKLSKLKVKGVAEELVNLRGEDGELVFYDIRAEGERRPIVLGTMISRIRVIVQNWKKYIAPLMETLVIEAVYQHALKAGNNPSSFKTAADMIMPKDAESNESKPALPSSAESILQRGAMATRITIGKAAVVKEAGNNGHECADTVHLVADGREEDITVEVVSLGDDKPLHGLHKRRNPTTGSFVPDTPVSPEDPVDNDGWDGMATTERPGRNSTG